MVSNRIPESRQLVSIAVTLAAIVVVPTTDCQESLAQTPSAKGGKAAAKADDPGAVALFDEVAKAYKSLASYSDQGQFVIAMTIAGKKQRQAVPLKLTFVRPNKLDFDAGEVRVASDGAQLTTAVMPLKRYTTTVAPQKLGLDTFREGPLGAVLFGGPAGAPMFVLSEPLDGPRSGRVDRPAQRFVSASAGQSRFLPWADAAKPESPALLIDLPDGPDLVLRVNPETKLLAGIELRIDPEQFAKSISAGGGLGDRTVRLDLRRTVSTQVAGDRSFAFKPPDGFTKVDSLAGQGGGQEEKTAVSDKARQAGA